MSMKKNYTLGLVKSLFVAILAACSMPAMAETFEYDFSSSIPQGWEASVAPYGFETTNSARGAQWTSSTTITLKGVKNASKVEITSSCNIDLKNSMEVSVGGTSWGNYVLNKETAVTRTFPGQTTASGDLVITLTRVEKSIYIKTIVVTADAIDGNTGSGNEPGGDNPSQNPSLDPNYQYGEPTVLMSTGEVTNNTAYSFVMNNIEVKCTAGAQTQDYFGCNAGNSITFTATKAIKAIVVNGYVKKDFEANATAGETYYIDASVDAVENDPVLAVLNINQPTVTINCVKQMRCYSVEVYFEENPEVDFDSGEGGEEGSYSYDWEPNEVRTFDLTMNELEVADWSEYFGIDYTVLYLTNDENALELPIFAATVNEKGIAPGTYPISFSCETGTAEASVGGDDMYDYGCFLQTDYEEEDGNYYYNPFYLVSGNIIVEDHAQGVKITVDAQSYNGSTVKATFIGMPNSEEDPSGIDNVADKTAETTTKQLRDGKIVIIKGDRTYNTAGQQIR